MQNPTELLDEIALLAIGSIAPQGKLAELQRDVSQNKATVEGYVDALLASSEFTDRVAPRIVASKWTLTSAASLATLEEASTMGGPVLYLAAGGLCDPKTAEVVNPWWAMARPVKVCRDAHRPANLRKRVGNGFRYCAPLAIESGDPFCGCGPNLVNCGTKSVLDQVSRSVRSELARTIGHVVQKDRPIDDAFTMNETVRDAYADALYQRWRILSGEQAGPFVPSGITSAQLRPRVESAPGEHAGILTTQNIFAEDSPRARTNAMYEVLWCTARGGEGPSADKVLSRGADSGLAVAPVCTDCHARLEYGAQFFKGFSGPLFEPQQQAKGKGPLYARNIDDRRGEAELSPHGFATLAVAQPEFARCVVDNVSRHVFAGSATADDEAALRAAFDGGHRLREVMRVALLRHVVSLQQPLVDRPRHARAPDAARGIVHARVGTPPGVADGRWFNFADAFADPIRDARFTPELATALAFEALQECKKLYESSPEKVRECVYSALSPAHLVVPAR